jgi:V8-like Glu-specific endopeptidase
MNRTITIQAMAIVLVFLTSLTAFGQLSVLNLGGQNDAPSGEKNVISDFPPLKEHEVEFSREEIQEFLEGLAQRNGNRIVGGQPVSIEDYPWQVSLQLRPSHGGQAFCGGTIINEEWVVTAAHCVFNNNNLVPASILRIRAGFTLLNDPVAGAHYNVLQVIAHPSYNPNANPNDIALLKVEPIDLSHPAKQAVPIVKQWDADQGLTNPGVLAKVSGWGATSFNGTMTNQLRAAQVPITNQHNYGSGHITPDMILAGSAGVDACQGDSGGPLVVPDGNGGYKLAGVVSWGAGCGVAGYPGVYARVSHFEQWIGEYVIISDPNQFTNIYFEGFEPGVSGGALPEGWAVKRNTLANGGLNGNNLQDVTGGSMTNKWFRISPLAYPYSQGSASDYVKAGAAALHIGYTAPDFTWAISPEIALPQTTGMILSFWPWITSNQQNNWITHMYVTVFANGQWQTLISMDNGATNTFNNAVTASLDQFAGQTIKIAFVHKYNDGYQVSIDDVAIRKQNPQVNAIWQVRHNGAAVADAVIEIPGVGSFTTDQSGNAQIEVYLGPHEYQFLVTKEGFFPYNGSVLITAENQAVVVNLEKIPAPEIVVTPPSIEIEISQGSQDLAILNIANPGNAQLTYSAVAVPLSRNNQNTETNKPATYQGFEVSEPFGSVLYHNHNGRSEQTTDLDLVEIHYDSGPNSGVGTNSAANWICAVRFTAEELNEYYGTYELAAIKFHIQSNHFSAVNVKVWEGGSTSGPGQEIYSANVTAQVVVENFTIHELNEPISLTSGQEYWIGYSINATGGFPSSTDAGPMVMNKGGWMFFNNTWSQLKLINEALNFNWVIRGLLSPVLGVDWLEISPSSGTVEAGENANVSLNFNTTELEVGTYQVNLLITNNAGPAVVVPVTMNVTPAVYDVIFNVKDHLNNPINDAVVTLGGTTNPQGNYTFSELPAGLYNYEVTKAGYITALGGIHLVNNNINVDVVLIPENLTTYTLTVNIKDEFNAPVENAFFRITDFGSYLTNAQGTVVITVLPGTIYYTYSKPGMMSGGGYFMLDSDLEKNFTMIYLRYNVNITSQPSAGGSFTGQGEYYHGQLATVTATAAENYYFMNWSEYGQVLSEEAQFSFNVLRERNLVANFHLVSHEITATAVPSNGGSVAGTGSHLHGSTVELVATPSSNWHFVSWKENGEIIPGAGAAYSFPAVANRDLEAHFAQNRYSVTFTVVGPGQTAVNDAVIKLGQTTNPAGNYIFNDILPGNYAFTVTRTGYQPATGTVNVSSSNVTRTVTLEWPVSIDDPAIAELKIYPVPVINSLNIEAAELIKHVQVIDLSGRMLFEITPAATHIQIPMESLRKGMYLVRITTSSNTVTRRIQKQ